MPEPSARPYDISLMGEGALLLCAPPPLDLAVQERVWQVAHAAAAWPGVRELVPSVNNLLVLFDPDSTDPDRIEDQLGRAWASAGPWTEPSRLGLGNYPPRWGVAIRP